VPKDLMSKNNFWYVKPLKNKALSHYSTPKWWH